MKITTYLTLFLLAFCSVSFGQSNVQAGGESPPTYVITIAGKTGGDVNKNQLLHAGSLEFIDKNQTGFVVTSFRMTVVKPHVGPVEFENPKSGVLTEAMRAALTACEPGYKVYFEYITYTDPDGNLMKHNALSFVIR